MIKGEGIRNNMDMQELRNIILEKHNTLELLNESEDYSLLYHLSPMRKNVVDWIDFEKHSSLLEVGAECGALTDMYANKVDRVVSIECDGEKLDIARLRHEALNNVEFRQGDIDILEDRERFDYIISIGSLMCNRTPFDDDMLVDYFKSAKAHLNTEGVLIFAVNNRYGISSFNSFRRDDGVTLSRKQISRTLKNAGYQDVSYYYPMPGYLFTREIFSDDRLPQEGECRDTTSAYMDDKYIMFSEDNTFDEVCRNGEFADFANSFLVMAE